LRLEHLDDVVELLARHRPMMRSRAVLPPHPALVMLTSCANSSSTSSCTWQSTRS
jgi:hypothetical protein